MNPTESEVLAWALRYWADARWTWSQYRGYYYREYRKSRDYRLAHAS